MLCCDLHFSIVLWLDRELQSNSLHGPIPEALWQLKWLKWLTLNNNQLTSTISPSIGNLKKLKDL